jgi:hypothetical protein
MGRWRRTFEVREKRPPVMRVPTSLFGDPPVYVTADELFFRCFGDSRGRQTTSGREEQERLPDDANASVRIAPGLSRGGSVVFPGRTRTLTALPRIRARHATEITVGN